MKDQDYARQKGAADLEVMRRCHIVQVGVGSGSKLTKELAAMGAGKVTAIDPDVVEMRNVPAQGYKHADAVKGTPKVVALERECREINPDVRFIGLQADFVRLSDSEVKRILRDADLLLMCTDHHPAQARGALAGLICDIPVILASIYRRGRAGEIIYTNPGVSKACYRCHTRERYEYVAHERTSGTGDAGGSLPFAAGHVDSIVGHLSIGLIHKRFQADNPYARWIDELDQRSFVQVRMDPHYRLGKEDIFGDVFGHHPKIFAFDTIWQEGQAAPTCPDCQGTGATRVGQRLAECTELGQLSCGCLVQKGSGIIHCPAAVAPATAQSGSSKERTWTRTACKN